MALNAKPPFPPYKEAWDALDACLDSQYCSELIITSTPSIGLGTRVSIAGQGRRTVINGNGLSATLRRGWAMFSAAGDGNEDPPNAD